MNTVPSRSAPIGEGAFQAQQSFDVEAFAAKYGGVSLSAHEPGSTLYVQGEPAHRMYYLQRGQAQLTVISAEGKEAIIAVLDPGDFCGEGCLLDDRVRVATATCIAHSTVARLERASVIRAVRQDLQFAEFFLLYVLNGVVQLRESLVSQLFDRSERRLARALLLLANYGKEGRGETVINNLDQEALAKMIGTTRSRVNHFMNKFRKLGYIDYSGRGNGCINVDSALLSSVLRDNLLGVAKYPAPTLTSLARS